MHEKGIIKHYIIPLSSLNAGTTHKNHLPSNSLEIVLLDDNLFKEQVNSLKCYVLHIKKIDEEDSRKFPKSTPKILASSMKRI